MTDVVVREEPPARRGRLTVRALIRSGVTPLRRLELYLDASQASDAVLPRRIRQCLGVLFGSYAVLLEVTAVRHGDLPVTPVLILMVAIALFIGRGGRFVHYFVPVALGLASYVVATRLTADLRLGVHYTPQIDAERLRIVSRFVRPEPAS